MKLTKYCVSLDLKRKKSVKEKERKEMGRRRGNKTKREETLLK